MSFATRNRRLGVGRGDAYGDISIASARGDRRLADARWSDVCVADVEGPADEEVMRSRAPSTVIVSFAGSVPLAPRISGSRRR